MPSKYQGVQISDNIKTNIRINKQVTFNYLVNDDNNG